MDFITQINCENISETERIKIYYNHHHSVASYFIAIQKKFTRKTYFGEEIIWRQISEFNFKNKTEAINKYTELLKLYK